MLNQFKPFATDGVDIKIHDGTYRKFHGEVVVALLDHKAAHELGGFFAAFNNMKRFCRHCLLHRDEIRCTDRSKFITRSPEAHDAIVNAIEGGDCVQGLQKLYGVKCYSVLNEIQNMNRISCILNLKENSSENYVSLIVTALIW